MGLGFWQTTDTSNRDDVEIVTDLKRNFLRHQNKMDTAQQQQHWQEHRHGLNTIR